MFDPFDPARPSPVSTPAVEAEIARRAALEDGAVKVQCVGCGDYDGDDGSERPHCRVCKRRRLYGTIIDRFVEFFFGPG